MNDKPSVVHVEIACFLECPKCRAENVEDRRVVAAISQRGLVIICRAHETEVVFSLHEVALRMAEATEREARRRVLSSPGGSA